MIRSSKLSLKFVNKEKQNKIALFIKEYTNLVSLFIDKIWDLEKIPARWSAVGRVCSLPGMPSRATAEYVPPRQMQVDMDWGCWEGVPVSALNRCNEQQKADV